MAELIQYIVNGVIYGALLSLVGLGTTVIFRTTQVLNFAQGGVMATTGYTAATLVKHISADLAGYWLMVLMAAALGAAIGVVLGLLMLTAEGRASHFELSVAALGFSFIVAWIDRVIFGADPILMPHVSTLSVTIFGASLSIEGLIIIAATLTIAFLTWLVIDKSRIGLAMRAVNEDAVTARTYGISRTTVTTVSWALGCAIAGVAGVFVGSYIEVSNATSLNISIISLAALVVGGLGSSVGALVGGVALGVASSLVAGYLAPNYKNSIVFLIVLAVLVVRPQGLFGEKRVKVSESGEQRRQLPALPRPGSWTKPTPIAGAVLFLAFLVLLPHIPRGYPLATYSVALAMAAAVLSIAFLQYYVGELNLGQGALVTIGGYTVAYLTNRFTDLPFLVAAVVAVVLASVVGAIAAALTLRMSGLHLAIATIVLVYVVIEIATQWRDVTGGASGTSLRAPDFGAANSTSNAYILAALVFIVVAAVGVMLLHSKLGYRVVALRDAPKAAQSMGISPNRMRTYAFAVSSGMAGLAGVALTTVVSFISPSDFGLLWSFTAIVGAVVGGGRLVSGAIIGGAYVTFIPVVFSEFSGVADGLFGVTLVVFIVLFPGGPTAMVERLIDMYRLRQARAATADTKRSPPKPEPELLLARSAAGDSDA